MATQTEVSATLAFLAAAYPRYEMTKDTVKVYAMGLDDVPADALEIGARQLSKASKWFPSLSELREESLKYANAGEMSDDDARRMAYRLLMSWHCCPNCWQHPCACHAELTVEDEAIAALAPV